MPRSDIAEIELACHELAERTEGKLDWKWDDYVGAVLATFTTDVAPDIMMLLDEVFVSSWDFRSVFKAPANIQNIAVKLGGIRKTQYLFVSDPEEEPLCYAAWWPWGDSKTISLRVGLASKTIGDHDIEWMLREFAAWFTDETR